MRLNLKGSYFRPLFDPFGVRNISLCAVRGCRRAHPRLLNFTASGQDVRYIRTTFVPGEAHCMCLFEAANPDVVKEVNEAAQIPFTRSLKLLI
jgi:hypothetical protein